MERARRKVVRWTALLVGTVILSGTPPEALGAQGRGPRVQVAMRFDATFGEKGAGLGQMLAPSDVTLDAAGNVYIADTGNHRVQKFSRHGVYVSEVGGFGWDDDQFNRPTGIATGAGLDLIVADGDNHRLKVYNQHLQLSGIIGGRNVDGTITLGRVGGVTASREGEVYATDYDVDRVVQISSFNRSDRSFGGFGYGAGDLRHPTAIEVTDDGTVIVADTDNDRIVLFDRFGNYRKTIGEDALQGPRGVCAGAGVVYVADSGNHRVVAFDAETGALAGKLGGPERDDRPGTFDTPSGLHLSGDRLYVVESGNGRIQVLKILVLRK